MLQSMRLQRVGHNLVTEKQQQTARERTHPRKIQIPLEKHDPNYKNSSWCTCQKSVTLRAASPGREKGPLTTSHVGPGILLPSTRERLRVVATVLRDRTGGERHTRL